MAIVDADILMKRSGSPEDDLGGVIGSTTITDNSLHNMFDIVSGAEASAGDTEYRLCYSLNNNSVNAGSFITGNEYTILVTGNTDFTLIGAANSLAGTTFTATGAGAGTGTAGLTARNMVVWVQTNTPSGDTTVEIAKDLAGVGDGTTSGVADTIADEGTAPAPSLTFSPAANVGAAISIGDIKAGQAIGIWVKRIISAAASAAANDNYVLRFQGETDA